MQRQFVVGASQERVWDLLGKVILQCLPLEKIDVVSESTFRAVLKWKLGFVTLPLNLRGEMVDVSPPSFLGCTLSVKRVIIRLAVKVTFSLTPVNQGKKTEIVCTAQPQGSGGIIPWIMRSQQQSFATNTFDSIRKRLEMRFSE